MSRRLIRNTPTKNSASGLWSLRDVIQFKTADLWPDASTYTLSRAAAFVFEGETQTITLITENVQDYSIIPYTITGITQDDLSAGLVSGDFVVINNTASVSFTFVDDGVNEITETATLSLPTVIPVESVTWEVYYRVSGQQAYITAGTYTFIVPQGVVSISAVVASGGGSGASVGPTYGGTGGNGGGLTYGNNISVTPGESLTVTIGTGGAGANGGSGIPTNGNSGQPSIISRGAEELIRANGGGGGTFSSVAIYSANPVGAGAMGTSWTGGANGGRGYSSAPEGNTAVAGGGGGAAGYLGNGGDGNGFPVAGSGAGGGGLTYGPFSGNAYGGNGGGVGIYGSGYTSATRSGNNAAAGSGGSLTNPTTAVFDRKYGGGSGGAGHTYGQWLSLPGGDGAARIIWGLNRAYPSTNTGDL